MAVVMTSTTKQKELDLSALIWLQTQESLEERNARAEAYSRSCKRNRFARDMINKIVFFAKRVGVVLSGVSIYLLICFVAG